MEKLNKETFFSLIEQHKPSFASGEIRAFSEMDWEKMRPFITEYVWEDEASLNVFMVKGTKHPDYIGMTWREFLDKGKRMSMNLAELERNPDYYFSTDRKEPTMSYIQIDGGDYFVDGDGNHRTAIAKFLFFLNAKTEIHGVRIDRYKVDWKMFSLFTDISTTVADKQLRYIVEPFSKHIAREDSAGWMKEIYAPGIMVRDLRKGSDFVMNHIEAENFKRALDKGSNFWRRIRQAIIPALIFAAQTIFAQPAIGADISDIDMSKKMEPYMDAARDIKKKAGAAMEKEDIKRFEEEFKNKLSNEIMPEVEKHKDYIGHDENGLKFGMTKKRDDKDNPKQQSALNLGDDERIYIFMSSSVPEEVWKRYVRRIDELHAGERVVLVLRGCIGGCARVMPTISFMQKLLTDDGKLKNGYAAQIWIDPLLFNLYGVKEAPCFVYAKSADLKTEEKENRVKNPYFAASYGDWNFEYHIDELSKISSKRLRP